MDDELDAKRAEIASGGGGFRRGELRTLFAFSLPLLRHARDHLHHYRALVGSRGGAVALGTIRQIVSDLVRNEFATAGGSDDRGSATDLPRDIVVQFAVGAYMSVLTWWLDRGAKLPPGAVAAMVRRLASEGIIARSG